MIVTKEGNELVIRVPIGSVTPSKSGKSSVVYSSHGNKTTDLIIQGKPVTIGLNAYIKA